MFQPHLLRSLVLSLPVMLSSPRCPGDSFQAQAQLMHPLLCEVLHVHGSTTATYLVRPLPTQSSALGFVHTPSCPLPPRMNPSSLYWFSSACYPSTWPSTQPQYILSECWLDGRVTTQSILMVPGRKYLF